MTSHERQTIRRIFEETLTAMSQTYVPAEEGIVEAQATNAAGVSVVVARYKLYLDGHWQCFEVLDDVLWPEPGQGDAPRG